MDKTSRPFVVGRRLSILQADLEYLIAILVGSTFLARLTSSLGFSDSLTGIISSIISLGCLFQLFSLLFRRKRVKSFVMTLSIVNQLLFLLLYVIPVVSLPSNVKTAIFTVSIVAAYFFYNVAHPKKISWLMSLVDDEIRGSFTANKEIISLASGIAFSLIMGRIIDSMEAKGNLSGAFVLTASVILVLTVLHTVTMAGCVEEVNVAPSRKVMASLLSMFKNKSVLSLALLFVLWNVASYSTVSFYGTYQIRELGFSQTLAMVLTTVGSLSRMAVSKFWGRLADRRSFAVMIEFCLCFALACWLAVAFATPKTGLVCFILYNLLHGIALGGINSALTNMIFDYVTPDKRADSLAFCQALAGLSGFFATLAVSLLVAHIQENGNTFLGIHVYAQQVTSVIASVFTLACILYVHFVVKKNKRLER